MHNLIAFIIKNGVWFFFLLLELICFYLIFEYNSYQRSIFLNSSNELVGRVYSTSGNIRSYFGLKENNQELLAQNAELQKKVWDLEGFIETKLSDTITTRAFVYDSIKTNRYEFIISKVLNNSITKTDNFITIDKGSNNGIKSEMGVVSQQGIVGIIREVSPNFARVQPILNSKSLLSCKIKGSNDPGTLVWDGEDYRYTNLERFPRHEKFNIGDVVVTSGFSNIFPPGIIVGIVEDSKNQNDDNFLTLRVRLSTDFASLSNVLVIIDNAGKERAELEKALDKNNAK